MVDVDNFKAYNDANGHLGGDECLKRIASAVSSEMRANDLVARYGGEEFAVILPEPVAQGRRHRGRTDPLPGRAAAGAAGHHAGHVTVSIGAATAIAARQRLNQLVAIADAALYRAKHMGRNRISLPITEEADCSTRVVQPFKLVNACRGTRSPTTAQGHGCAVHVFKPTLNC